MADLRINRQLVAEDISMALHWKIREQLINEGVFKQYCKAIADAYNKPPVDLTEYVSPIAVAERQPIVTLLNGVIIKITFGGKTYES